jgi:hypothetical protein
MSHPYKNLPHYNRWSSAVGNVDYPDVDPVAKFPFTVNSDEKVATAGSCFAQHIARRLKGSGYNYFVTEPGHPLASEELAERFNYRVFSARYGNIYTTRQLVQLLERAYGERTPAQDFWRLPDGRYVDPLRPTVEPGGFSSLEELEVDRIQHLASVRKMFEELDVFVFTLGLTEAWVDREDGTVFPICPGVAGGDFDPNRHVFKNFRLEEIVSDLNFVIGRILSLNPKARFILTVSPVPLAATAEDQHVLVSTTLSKSVLRVACDEIVRSQPSRLGYFPSYELITGSFNRGRYFGTDLRSVTDEGVGHVMRLFMKHVAGDTSISQTPRSSDDAALVRLSQLQAVQQVVCDEEMLDFGRN